MSKKQANSKRKVNKPNVGPNMVLYYFRSVNMSSDGPLTSPGYSLVTQTPQATPTTDHTTFPVREAEYQEVREREPRGYEVPIQTRSKSTGRENLLTSNSYSTPP